MSTTVDPSIDLNQVRRNSKTSSKSNGSLSTEEEDLLPSKQGSKLSTTGIGKKLSNKSNGKYLLLYIYI